MSSADKIGLEFVLKQVLSPASKQAKAYSAKFCQIPGFENYFAVIGSSAPNAVCIYKLSATKEIEIVQYYLDEDVAEVCV